MHVCVSLHALWHVQACVHMGVFPVWKAMLLIKTKRVAQSMVVIWLKKDSAVYF